MLDLPTPGFINQAKLEQLFCSTVHLIVKYTFGNRILRYQNLQFYLFTVLVLKL